MAEEGLVETDGAEVGPRELSDLVEHWGQAIDRWVQHIDRGMGGQPTARVRLGWMPRPRRLRIQPLWRLDEYEQGGSLAERIEENEVYLDKQLVITRTGSPSGLSVSGSIDYYNAEAVAAVLTRELNSSAPGADGLSDAITGNGDLHIDVTMLEFADVTGIRALVRIAENGTGRRLVLRGLPSRIRTVITVVGWSDHPSLVLEGESEQR